MHQSMLSNEQNGRWWPSRMDFMMYIAEWKLFCRFAGLEVAGAVPEQSIRPRLSAIKFNSSSSIHIDWVEVSCISQHIVCRAADII